MKYYIFLLSLLGGIFIINTNQVYAQSADSLSTSYLYGFELKNTITKKTFVIDTGTQLVIYLKNQTKIEGTLVKVDSDYLVVEKNNVNPLIRIYVNINPEEIYRIKAGSLWEIGTVSFVLSGLSLLTGGLLNAAHDVYNASVYLTSLGLVNLGDSNPGPGRPFFVAALVTTTVGIIFFASKRKYAAVDGWTYRIVIGS